MGRFRVGTFMGLKFANSPILKVRTLKFIGVEELTIKLMRYLYL